MNNCLRKLLHMIKQILNHNYGVVNDKWFEIHLYQKVTCSFREQPVIYINLHLTCGTMDYTDEIKKPVIILINAWLQKTSFQLGIPVSIPSKHKPTSLYFRINEDSNVLLLCIGHILYILLVVRVSVAAFLMQSKQTEDYLRKELCVWILIPFPPGQLDLHWTVSKG